jgi:phosphomannomutase
MQAKRIIALFDVDLTLTPARQLVQPLMLETLSKMRAKGISFGIVSGSDLNKVKEQLTEAVVVDADYCFAENGLYAMAKG